VFKVISFINLIDLSYMLFFKSLTPNTDGGNNSIRCNPYGVTGNTSTMEYRGCLGEKN